MKDNINKPIGEADYNTVFAYREPTPEELEWLKAIDRLRTRIRPRFPTWLEVLDLAKELGYRKAIKETT